MLFKGPISKEKWDASKEKLQRRADAYDSHEITVDSQDEKVDHKQLSQAIQSDKSKKNRNKKSWHSPLKAHTSAIFIKYY